MPALDQAPKIRSCGDCQACCVVYEIDELKKPAHARCPHQCSSGCAIWRSKPLECTAYACLWLMGAFKDNMRPDKSGVVVDALPIGNFLHPDLLDQTRSGVRVIEVQRGAATLPGNAAMIATFVNSPKCIVMLCGPATNDSDDRWMLHPGSRRTRLTRVERANGEPYGWSLPEHRAEYQRFLDNPPPGAKEEFRRREELLAQFNEEDRKHIHRFWNIAISSFSEDDTMDRRVDVVKNLLDEYKKTLNFFSGAST